MQFRIILLFFFSIANISTPTQAASITEAKSFVENLGARAISTLTDSSLPDAQIGSKFQQLLQEGFAINDIARFVLGRYWGQASSSQQTRFISLFEKRLELSYAARFKEYKGVSFSVKEGRIEADKGVVINSTIQKPGGPIIRVDWKIYKSNGTIKIFDVIVDGVSMSITLRSDYAAALQRQGNNIEAFLKSLMN